MPVTGPLATLNPLVFEQQLAIKQEQAALKEAEACSELGDDIDDDNVPLGIICASSTTHSPSVNAAALKQDEEIIRTPQLSKTSMALFAGKHGASGDDQRSRYTPNGGVRLSYSSDALSTPVLRSEKYEAVCGAE